MGCCGDNGDGAIKQTIDIARGSVRLTTDKIGITKKYKFTDSRIRICQKCDESTWMTGLEYKLWLVNNGIEVLENYNQLEKLPKLPKHEIDNRRRNIYCRICKCYVPRRACLEEQICHYPEGDKWDLNRLENDRK